MLEAGQASVGVVAVVDAEPAHAVATVGSVVVLRAARGADLLRLWDTAVVRA